MGDVEYGFMENTEVDPAPATEESDTNGYSFLGKEKEEDPCDNFRLDTTAGFGMCRCGHPKSAHEAKGTNKAAELLTKLKANNNRPELETASGIIEPGDGPCNKFRLDTTASEFGVCKCGFKRADHAAQSANKAKQALDRLKSSNLDKYKDYLSNIDTSGPCNNYRVDTSAAEFGVCHCGFKKEDHVVKDENAAAKMLRKLKDKNRVRNEMDDKEAAGFVETPVPEEIPGDAEVNQLNNAETAANSKNKPKKDKGGKKGPCVIC